MKFLALPIAFALITLASCQFAASEYESRAKILVEPTQGEMTGALLSNEREWQAKCIALVKEGTTAGFDELEGGVWVLRVCGPNPRLTEDSCGDVVDAYISNADPSVKRLLLAMPTVGFRTR